MTVIAALGSSFAAGPGIEPIVDAAAMRSGENYAHKLARSLGARLTDLSVAGATTANLLDEPQETDSGVVFAPQVDGIPPEAELITILAGGNDLRFLGAMVYVALSRREPQLEMVRRMAPQFADGIPMPSAAEVARATDGLARVVAAARRRAPGARVVLVDYLTVVAGCSASVARFTEPEVARFIAIQDEVRRVFSDAAGRTGAELVRASALSEEHALGSAEPWVQPMGGLSSLHPNELGMAVIAAELERRLGGAGPGG